MVMEQFQSVCQIFVFLRGYSQGWYRYFRKFEKYLPDPEQPYIDQFLKGTNGPVRVGYHTYIGPPAKAFVKAAINLGIPHNSDFNTAQGSIGVNRVCATFSVCDIK